MFVCRACARRASTNLLRRIPPADNRLAAPSRAFATNSLLRQPQPASEPQNLSSDWGDLEDAVEKKAVNHGDRAAEKQKALGKMKRAVQIELRHTTDPYHIAEEVAKKLSHNEFEKALMLTREASKDKQVVVCWNYMIAQEFTNQKLQSAIKLYNEMKKRAQLPNAHTYTTIFRGCAESKHLKLAVNEALKIYNSMLASTRLKPNQIHLNALLNLCSRAGDIESIFIVLRSANGIRAPDNMTYTIILNALRCQRENGINPNEEDERIEKESVMTSRAKTISRAKLVWDEVITRWKKGEVSMDEELVCAMGRVLLLGGAAETDSVLGVVGEVLDITKLRDDESGLIGASAHKVQQSKTLDKPKIQDKTRRIEKAEDFEDFDKGEDFASSRPKEAKSAAPMPHNTPGTPPGPMSVARMAGNNTLSLVMRALALARRTRLAARYWDYLLQVHNIVPDRRNYRDYIDCLSTGAASGKAARVLVSMPNTIVDGNLYRRGLLLCHFDAFNDSAFENATLIHRAMVRKLRVPDARCLKLYLQIAMNSYRKFTNREKYPSEEIGRRAHGEQILVALDDVFEPVQLAINDLDYSHGALSLEPAVAWKKTWKRRQELFEVMHKCMAACDKLLAGNLIDRTDDNFRVVRTRRNILHHKVGQINAASRLYTGVDAWTSRETRDEVEDGWVSPRPGKSHSPSQRLVQ